MFSNCSGTAPPSRVYISRRRVSSPARISPSFSASPGASAPFQCHCSQRPELTIEPFSSAKQVDGRRNTSVWIFDGSTSLNSSWFCQKLAVSVFSGSMVTRNFNLASEATTLFLFGNEATGLKPWQI
ncbi:hypothetical protein D3C80_1737970 [compost metagenome]